MTSRARKAITDRTLLASCLARLFEIPHSHQQAMHEDQMISLAHRDHWPVPHAEGGSNHFSNVWARLIREHREKTATIDIPAIAKGKRIRRKEAERHAAMAAKEAGEPAPRRDRKSRLQSRGFDKARTRTFAGKVRERKRRRQ